MLQTAKKKTTTTAIAMATTVEASKEASDIRRLCGVAKSPDGVAPGELVDERPATAVRGASPPERSRATIPKPAARTAPQPPHTAPVDCGSANAITTPAAAASTTKAPAVILIRLDPSPMKQTAPVTTKSPSTIQVSAALPIMAAPPSPAMNPKRRPPSDIRMLTTDS